MFKSLIFKTVSIRLTSYGFDTCENVIGNHDKNYSYKNFINIKTVNEILAIYSHREGK